MAQNKPFPNENMLRHALGDLDLFLYPVIDSTNDEAKRLIKSGTTPPFLVAANEQTHGRGRQGKSFYSPADTGIYMSLVLSFSDGESISKITVIASVAVCKAIEKLTGLKPEIKWVNDVYLNGKKICGILCESVIGGTDLTPVIIGVGLNLSTTDFPEEIKNAGSLFSDISRERLICEIVSELTALSGVELNAVLSYYREHSLILGKEISFVINGVSQKGTAVDVDSSGALVVRKSDGSLTALNSLFSITDY